METIGSEKWQELENEFLDGEMDEEAFCKAKGLNLEWFRGELRKFSPWQDAFAKQEEPLAEVRFYVTGASADHSSADSAVHYSIRVD